MEIYFLDVDTATQHLQNLQIVDPQMGCTASHHGNIVPFSREQRAILEDAIQSLPLAGRMDFILLRAGTYWDFPFTWGHWTVVVTTKFFERPADDIIKILTHEWVHLDQRRHPLKYENYYQRTLGFRKRQLNFGRWSQYLLRNPDGDRYEWEWLDGHKRYIPMATHEHFGSSCQFRTLLLEVSLPDYTVTHSHPVEQVSSYWNRFGTRKQLYHPNEIIANIIADYLVNGTKYPQINYQEIDTLLR